jgi:MFS family permease
MTQPAPRLYSFQFILLCFSQATFAGSFTMIIPELPAYLTSLGGEEYKGLIISLFTLMAGISRPFSGKLSDTIGRIPVMVIGTLACVICSFLYPVLSTVAGFLFLRLMHGMSTGFKPTASTAYVADIVPEHRRGEAMGILGVSMNTGASIAPPIGSWVTMQYSVEMMFYVSSGVALFSILILLGLKETLSDKVRFHPRLLLIKRDEIIDFSALPPAVATMLVYMSYGVILTIVPDQSEFLGISNKGLFFTSLTFCSLLSRLVAGRVSDLYGRVPVLKVAVLGVVVSLIFMGLAYSPVTLLVASGCMGFSTGIASPAIFAWAIDRSNAKHRGKAMATVYIFLEIGIGAGALVSAWLYANDAANFGMTFFIVAAVSSLAFFYLQFYPWTRQGD